MINFYRIIQVDKMNFRVYALTIFLVFICTLGFSQSYDSKTIHGDLNVFADSLATSLRKGVSKKQIDNIKNPAVKAVATKMSEGNYSLDYRYADYKPLLSTELLGEQLGIGNGYSKYENVTGIYLEKGQHVLLASGISDSSKISIWVANWNRRAPEGVSPTKDPAGWGIKKQIIPIQNGINVIDVDQHDGLAYIHYFSENPEAEKPISVHFLNGAVNGVFDIRKHNNQDWERLLNEAVYPIIDGLGQYIQVVYPVEDLKKYAKGRGVELISAYDTLLLYQFRVVGFEKYNRIPNNRILSRVNYNYYMFRDGDGVAYMGTQPGYALNRVLDPELIITSGACWGFAHEVGHVHQHRNYFNWAGMGEVSNNVSTMYVTMAVGHENNLKKRDHYIKAQTEIIDSAKSYLEVNDHMTRLVPFWQLHLYFLQQENKSDFYADMHETLRQQAIRKEIDNPSRNPAIYQLNFVKKACEIGRTDLTDFFEAYGFFKIDSFNVKDYRSADYVMTQEMVDECKTYIASLGLPKPKVDLTKLVD